MGASVWFTHQNRSRWKIDEREQTAAADGGAKDAATYCPQRESEEGHKERRPVPARDAVDQETAVIWKHTRRHHSDINAIQDDHGAKTSQRLPTVAVDDVQQQLQVVLGLFHQVP